MHMMITKGKILNLLVIAYYVIFAFCYTVSPHTLCNIL